MILDIHLVAMRSQEALALLQRDDKGNRRYTFAELMMRLLA